MKQLVVLDLLCNQSLNIKVDVSICRIPHANFYFSVHLCMQIRPI